MLFFEKTMVAPEKLELYKGIKKQAALRGRPFFIDC